MEQAQACNEACEAVLPTTARLASKHKHHSKGGLHRWDLLHSPDMRFQVDVQISTGLFLLT